MSSVLGTLALNAQQQLVIVSPMVCAITAGSGTALVQNPSVCHWAALTGFSHELQSAKCDLQILPES